MKNLYEIYTYKEQYYILDYANPYGKMKLPSGAWLECVNYLRIVKEIYEPSSEVRVDTSMPCFTRIRRDFFDKFKEVKLEETE